MAVAQPPVRDLSWYRWQLMQRVVNFANGQKLLGEDGNGLSRLGISFGDSLVMGNNKQIKLRFDPTYLQLATDQQL